MTGRRHNRTQVTERRAEPEQLVGDLDQCQERWPTSLAAG
jgi:hypothetical protein